MRLAALALAAVLAGCSPASKAFIDEGITGVQDVEDTKARTLVAALCAITIGAKHRVLNAEERRHVEALCGAEVPEPVTAAEMRTILEAR